jgi:hypothetical protein
MDEQDVVHVSIVPPGLLVVHVALVGIALLFPLEPSPRDPVAPELMNVRRRRRERVADAIRQAVEKREEAWRTAGVVIPERHEHVTRVTADDDSDEQKSAWPPPSASETTSKESSSSRPEASSRRAARATER